MRSTCLGYATRRSPDVDRVLHDQALFRDIDILSKWENGDAAWLCVARRALSTKICNR
jgi:hypothetical protein